MRLAARQHGQTCRPGSGRAVYSPVEPLRGAGQNANVHPLPCLWLCRHLKRTDFCLWSAPPAPLAGVVGALLGDDFPRTVYEHNCSGFLQDRERPDKLIPAAPVVSENILLCGMREVNASWSRQSDRNHWASRHIVSGPGSPGY